MSDHPISVKLMDYLDGLVPPRPPRMQEMEAYGRETHFPIIGPAAGYHCYLVARLIGATRIFELGSGYGYSTAWFAKAAAENAADGAKKAAGTAEVHHVVWDRDLSAKARGHLAALGFEGLIRYHVGEAVAALKRASGPFDLVFNDIDKEGYPASIPVIKKKLRPGGVLIVDNMLWHGQIWDAKDRSAATQGVREATRLLTQGGDWIASIVPIRDGIIVAQRR